MPEQPPTSPLIVTLGFDEGTFARLDALRRRFFPSERNLIPAHLSLFHALPPGEIAAVSAELAEAAGSRPPISLQFSSVRSLGSGFALAVDAHGLPALHRRLAVAFAPWLSSQDRQPFVPHVTIMNKADRLAARLGLAGFRDEFEPWSGTGDSLLLWAYLGGPWEALARYPFSGDPRPDPEV
jgi:2'-5' RNA ligase